MLGKFNPPSIISGNAYLGMIVTKNQPIIRLPNILLKWSAIIY